jgi:hypothetical protein
VPKQRLAARRVGGKWVIEIARQVEFDLEQAAVALARMSPRGRVGEATIQRACRAEAAAPASERTPDAVSVATYREELERGGVWARVAKVRRPGAELTYLVYLPEHYDLERAAAALAGHFEIRPSKAGHRTAQRALIAITNPEPEQNAGEADEVETPDAGEVAFWRELLVREYGFPSEAA